MTDHYLLVMAGGRGTRFWPESTRSKPKQYLSLIHRDSLLTQTLKRFDGCIPSENRFVVTVQEQVKLCQKHSQGLASQNALIVEPQAKNTAGCILLGLASLLGRGASEESMVAIVPSDHVIVNTQAFQNDLKMAFDISHGKQKIVALGVKPHFPHTGFGYIERGDSLDKDAYVVASFKEKPSENVAMEYLKSGQYYWNAGMFVAPLGLFLQEYKRHADDIFDFLERLKNCHDNPKELAAVYAQIPADSFDYAVMEKSQNCAVLEAQFDWNDLGSWSALEGLIKATEHNTLAKDLGHYVHNSRGNVVYAPDQFVGLIDTHDMVIISNDKALVIAPKSKDQEIKRIVDYLQFSKKDELL